MATSTQSESQVSAEPAHVEQTLRERRNARYGLVLFAVYLALYATFMALNVLDPAAMKNEVLAGMNLAIVFGFGLIAAALVLAIVYMALCHRGGAEGDR
jgi:uncharacterized membrane protein (DUF485 family)